MLAKLLNLIIKIDHQNLNIFARFENKDYIMMKIK